MYEEVELPRTNGEEKLRKVLREMKRRCQDPKNGKYHRYGGRGITVCAEWGEYVNFRTWSIENGYQEGLTLDRVDNDGNYEPSNCRWTTKRQQSRNTSKNHIITAFGETKTMVEWVEDPRCVVAYGTFQLRVYRRGWEAERALITPEVNNNGKATYCPQGHAYTPDNIYWEGPHKTWRKCITCSRKRGRDRHARKKNRT